MDRRLFLGYAGVFTTGLILEPVKTLAGYRLDEYCIVITDSDGNKHRTLRPKVEGTRNHVVWKCGPIVPTRQGLKLVRFEMFEPDYGLRVEDHKLDVLVWGRIANCNFRMSHKGDGPDLRTPEGRKEFTKMYPGITVW